MSCTSIHFCLSTAQVCLGWPLLLVGKKAVAHIAVARWRNFDSCAPLFFCHGKEGQWLVWGNPKFVKHDLKFFLGSSSNPQVDHGYLDLKQGTKVQYRSQLDTVCFFVRSMPDPKVYAVDQGIKAPRMFVSSEPVLRKSNSSRYT